MFKSKQSFAINFSDYSIEALELTRDKGGFAVGSYNRVLLEPGIIEDGKIIQPEKLRGIVRKLLAQAEPHPIEAREVAVTIPESKVFVQRFSLPRSYADRQVPPALMSQAHETLPIESSQIAADFLELARDGELKEYLFAATYKSVIKEYVALFQTIGLKVSLLTMESLALGASILSSAKDETVLILDIGARTTIASIFRAGEPQETININIAGNNITNALAEKLSLSRAEAEQRKIATGLTATPESGGAELLVIQGQLQPLKDEVLVFIKYYEQQTRDAIDRVILSGGTSGMAGIVDYFESNLGLSAEIGVLQPQFHTSLKPASLTTFLTVLGLGAIALGETKGRINFLARGDKDWESKEHIAKSSTIPAIPVANEKREVEKKPSKGRAKRFVMYLTLLLIAGGLFGGVYVWKYGFPDSAGVIPSAPEVELPPRTIPLTIQPLVLGEEIPREIFSFAFSVSTNSEASGADIVLGTFETLEVDEQVQYDTALTELVVRELNREGIAQPTPEQINERQTTLLADRLWEEKLSEIEGGAGDTNRLVLDSYFTKEILLSELVPSPDNPDRSVQAIRLRVRYRALVISDRLAFNELEGERIEVVSAGDANKKLVSRRFEFSEPDPSGRIDILARYTFQSNP